MKLSQLLFGAISVAFLFGSAGYFYGNQMKLAAVSPLHTTDVRQADVFDFKMIGLNGGEDVVKIAAEILFKQPKYDVKFIVSENKINNIKEHLAVLEINTDFVHIKPLKTRVDFSYELERSIHMTFSRMDKIPTPLLSLKSCNKAVKKIEPQKPKNNCPHKKSNKRDRLKRFKKSASWI